MLNTQSGRGVPKRPPEQRGYSTKIPTRDRRFVVVPGRLAWLANPDWVLNRSAGLGLVGAGVGARLALGDSQRDDVAAA